MYQTRNTSFDTIHWMLNESPFKSPPPRRRHMACAPCRPAADLANQRQHKQTLISNPKTILMQPMQRLSMASTCTQHVAASSSLRLLFRRLKHSFIQRIINSWNSLPACVVNAKTVNGFKNAYDRNCRNDMYIRSRWACRSIILQVTSTSLLVDWKNDPIVFWRHVLLLLYWSVYWRAFVAS